jgi:hypothetical protein
MDHPTATTDRIPNQPQPAKIDLHLHPRIPIHDRHSGPAPTKPQLIDRIPVQRAIRHHHPTPGQQHVHLGHRHTPIQPGLDLFSMRRQRFPGRPYPTRPVRAHRSDHLPHQLIRQLTHTAFLAHPHGLRRGQIPADRFAVHPSQIRHRPQRMTGQPQPKNLPDLDHRHLPVAHAGNQWPHDRADEAPRRMVPLLPTRWSHHWQAPGPMLVAAPPLRWSHARGS